jgi:peptide/nickel transport system substrate-binding protein
MIGQPQYRWSWRATTSAALSAAFRRSTVDRQKALTLGKVPVAPWQSRVAGRRDRVLSFICDEAVGLLFGGYPGSMGVSSVLRSFAVLLLITAATTRSLSAADLRIALRDDPDVLDPTLATTYTGRIVFGGLCDKLFDLDAHLNIVPQLATGYTWTDSQTLLIPLRQGVKFQDGTTMDAYAVKASLDRHLTLAGSFRRLELNQIDHVEVVDPATVRIVLKSPSSPFMAPLTDRAGMILAPEAAKDPKSFAQHPVCSGPFRFVERVEQDHITLERFPDYWNAAAIHFDHVIYRTIPDSTVRLANLKAGAIDISEYIVPTDAESIRTDPKLKLVVSDALGYYGITNNLANGPAASTPYAKDPRVRKAFELSIDRTALLSVVYNGMFPASAQSVSQGSPFYASSVQPPPRDIIAAKRLLQEAGVALPVTVNLSVANSPDLVQVAEVIQSMAAEAGFNVKINAMEARTQLTSAMQGDFEAAIFYWSGRSDIDGNTYTFLHTGGPLNSGHYSNSSVDSLLDQARQVTDIAARRALYEKMWQQAAQDLPITYLWTWKNIVGMSAKIQGFTPIADGMIRLQGMSASP